MQRIMSNSGNTHLRAGFQKRFGMMLHDDIDTGEQTDSFRLHLIQE